MSCPNNPSIRHKQNITAAQLARQLSDALDTASTRNNPGARMLCEQVWQSGILHGNKTLVAGDLFKRFFWHGRGYRI